MHGDTTGPGLSIRLTRLATVLIGVEAAGLMTGGIYAGVETISSTPESTGSAIGLVVIAALLAAGLAACGGAALRHRSWVRGPVLTWQLVQGGVAMRLTVLAAWWIGLPLLAMAVVTGILIAGPWVLPPRESARE